MGGADAERAAGRVIGPVGPRQRDREHVGQHQIRLGVDEEAGAKIHRIAVGRAAGRIWPRCLPKALIPNHRAGEFVDPDPGIRHNLPPVIGDEPLAVDVPASLLGVVVPEVERGPRSSVVGVGVDEPRPSVAGTVQVGATWLDGEVDRDVHALGEREWGAVERDGRDTHLPHHLALVIRDRGPGRDPELESGQARGGDHHLLRGRHGDGHRVRQVQGRHPDRVRQHARLALEQIDADLEHPVGSARLGGAAAVDEQLVVTRRDPGQQEPARHIGPGSDPPACAPPLDRQRRVSQRLAVQLQHLPGQRRHAHWGLEGWQVLPA